MRQPNPHMFQVLCRHHTIHPKILQYTSPKNKGFLLQNHTIIILPKIILIQQYNLWFSVMSFITFYGFSIQVLYIFIPRSLTVLLSLCMVHFLNLFSNFLLPVSKILLISTFKYYQQPLLTHISWATRNLSWVLL